MKRLPFIILILLLTTISCNKDTDNQEHNPCGTPTTVYLKSADLLNCRYKTGTNWVFIDSLNNATDSLLITRYSQGFLDDVCGNSYENHLFKTVSYPSLETTDYIIVQGGLFKNFDGTTNSGTLIYYDYNAAISMTNFIITRFDSLYIFDRFYKHVLKTVIDNDYSEAHHKSIYYINSEFGFLKHEIYAGETLISNKVLMRKNILR